MLASDAANPDFVGATNPDARLAVRFYSKPMPNPWRSAQEGRPIYEDTDMVRIEVPGDRTTIIDTLARPEHQERFPIQWARYKNAKGESQETGTPITQWPMISSSQAEELKALGFRTVDAVASASDAQVQRVGMIAGMGWHAFRERAKAFLQAAHDSALVQNQAAALAEKQQEMDALKAEMELRNAKLQEQIDRLTQALEKPRRGRPPKQEA